MNRRTFTASLAALVAAPALPLTGAAPVAAAPTIPAGAYAWGQLIARAQSTCTPAMLAQHLNLSPDVARALFNEMLRDGVLRAPGLAGVARATAPIQTTGTEHNLGKRLASKTNDLIRSVTASEDQRDEATPLVNPDATGLGCADASPEDPTYARTDQSTQESPRRG